MGTAMGVHTRTDRQGLDVLYAYVKANPEQEGEIQTAISTLPSAVQTYVRRMLESRRAAENPCKCGVVLCLLFIVPVLPFFGPLMATGTGYGPKRPVPSEGKQRADIQPQPAHTRHSPPPDPSPSNPFRRQ